MSNLDVFCLTSDGKNLLSPSIQATILAKYSRSSKSAKEILGEINQDDADKFQEKWVVNYGHSSVAELASIPICFEGVSIIASKYIESWQRAGYSEKSTRYQEFTRDSFITPPGSSETMKNFVSRFYDAYISMMQPMKEIISKKTGKGIEENVVKARAFDNLRYLLPSGTGTNLAAVVNIRDARDMIKGMRAHTNPELNLIGEKVYEAVMGIVPTLVKHTEPEYFNLPVISSGTLHEFDFNNPSPRVSMDHDYFNNVNQVLSKFIGNVKIVHGMEWGVFCNIMNKRPPHSEVPKIFRDIKLSFDIIMDYGAFRDLQRHRRCEQLSEPLNINYGYIIPDDIIGTSLESEYVNLMNSVESYCDESVVFNRDLFQYIIPLGYLHRSKFSMDLAELYYIAELRTKPQGHISYRRIAYEMYEKANRLFPELMQWCRVTKPDIIGEHN